MPDLSELQLEWNSFWSWYHSRNSQEHLYTANWANLHQMKHHLQRKDNEHSLLLATGPYNRPVRVYPAKTKPQLGNVLDIGPSQCGKTTKEITQILDWQGSVVANDIKDDIRRATAGWRSLLGNGKIFTVDVSGRGDRFDPLEGLETEDDLYDAACQLLYNPAEKDKYWTNRAARMLTQILLAARLMGRRPLPFAAELINLGLSKTAIQLNVIDPHLAQRFLEAEFVPRKDYSAERTALSDAWSNLTAFLYPVLTPQVLKSFEGFDFTAADILFSKEPVTVYFCWPEEKLHALEPLIRLVWESLVKDFKRLCRLYPERPRQKVLLSLDEAGITGLSRLPEDAATLNGRGISVSMNAQDIEQFRTLYGDSRMKSLMNNIESKIIHRQASYDTIRYFQLLMDFTSGFASSSNNRHGETESEGRSEREIPLITVRQFQELRDEEVVVLSRNTPPMRARRLGVKDVPTLAQRRNVQAPPLLALPPPRRFSSFQPWNRRYLEPGMYQLPQFALGYAIPLPPSRQASA